MDNEQYKKDYKAWQDYEAWVKGNYGAPPSLRNDEGGGLLAINEFYNDPTKQMLYSGVGQQDKPQQAPSPGSSGPGGGGGSHMAMGGTPDYDKAKDEWASFKTGFAERVQAITEEMSAKGAQSWEGARSYVSGGLAGPSRDAAYREQRPDYAFAEWLQTPGAREHYEWETGEKIPEGHWALDDPGTPLDHYRNHGRVQGTPYVDPERGRYAHQGAAADKEFQEWIQTPGAREYYEWRTGYGL